MDCTTPQDIVTPEKINAHANTPRARWITELEQRLLSSMRTLKMENEELRSEVRKLQDSLGAAQGDREKLSVKSQQLESELTHTQSKTLETAQEVQWLLKQSQEILEVRQQELQRLRSELESAHRRFQQCEGLFLRGQYPRKKVMPPRNLAPLTAAGRK